MGLMKCWDKLGFAMDHELSIDLIMSRFSDSFAQFVLNYRINNIEISIPKLINIVKAVEPSLKKEGKTMILKDTFSYKKSSKNNKKKKLMKLKGGVAKKKAKEITSKGTCFHCGKSGH